MIRGTRGAALATLTLTVAGLAATHAATTGPAVSFLSLP